MSKKDYSIAALFAQREKHDLIISGIHEILDLLEGENCTGDYEEYDSYYVNKYLGITELCLKYLKPFKDDFSRYEELKEYNAGLKKQYKKLKTEEKK